MHSIIQEGPFLSQWAKIKWEAIIIRCCHDFYTLCLETPPAQLQYSSSKKLLQECHCIWQRSCSSWKSSRMAIFAFRLIELLSLEIGSPDRNCTPGRALSCPIHNVPTTPAPRHCNSNLLLHPFLQLTLKILRLCFIFLFFTFYLSILCP